MIFNIQHPSKKVSDGYSIAAEILMGQDIQERILDLRKLTYTTATPKEVASALAFHIESIVSGLTPKIPVLNYYDKGSAIATTFSDKVGIYVNDRLVNNHVVTDYISNAAHEWAHSPMGFRHGSNWMQDTWFHRRMCNACGDFADKGQSVPLLFGKMVLQLAKEKRLVNL